MDLVKQFREYTRQLECHIGNMNNSDCCCCGVSETQCFVLVEIGRKPNISVKELAEILRLDKSGISRTVEELVRKKYVERKPSEEELSEAMGITINKLREIIKVAQEPLSLETPIGKEEDSRLGDFIEDKEADAPVKMVASELLKEDLAEVLCTLSPRERDVLRLRFGMDDGRQRTLEEVGQLFGVTRERIRQIEAKALRKLRHPSRSRKLKDYLE